MTVMNLVMTTTSTMLLHPLQAGSQQTNEGTNAAHPDGDVKDVFILSMVSDSEDERIMRPVWAPIERKKSEMDPPGVENGRKDRRWKPGVNFGWKVK